MNRKALALTVILALLMSTLAATLLVHVVTANPFMPSGSWSDEPIQPLINVQSPSESLNYWTGSTVWLNFTVTVPLTNWYSKTSFRYPDYYATTFGNVTQVHFSLDGKPENNLNKISEHEGILSFSVNLGRLPVGQHTIIISAEGSGYYGNLTHDSWSDSFQQNAQESDKTKLVLSSVQNNFVVGATASPELFPTVPVVAVSAAIVVVVGAGLLVYFKKFRRGIKAQR